jgi:beta-lactamase class A
MKLNCLTFLFPALSFCIACSSSQKIQKQPADIIEQLMAAQPSEFSDILRNRDSLRVQIIYSQIDRDIKNMPIFTNYFFNVNPSKYYYPASTVKLPTALLALEKINKMKKAGVHVSSSMITENASSNLTPVYNDPTTEDGRPTIEHYIKKIFLVSDNDAFNRLYEFLGQEYVNSELHKKGYKQTDILHRLSIFLTEEENRTTNPILFLDDTSHLIFSQPIKYNSKSYPVRKDSVGLGYYSKGELVKRPMSFSAKNRLPLEELHSMMRALMFPASVKKKNRFNLSDEQYRFVWQYLSQYPTEGNYPPYDSTHYWDAYGKFLYWGGEKGSLPRNFRSFSKEGDAYGFLIDAAYIVDFDKNVEFLLSAVIYCNQDGILNDDQYDYSSVGLPFMKQLGRLIYEHELKRPRTRQPDLSTFRLDYRN